MNEPAKHETTCPGNHRLNLEALNGKFREIRAHLTAGGNPHAARIMGRVERTVLAVAFKVGPGIWRMPARELANRTRASRRTGHRAVADAVTLGLLDYQAGGFSRDGGGKGVPVRQPPLVQLSVSVRAAACTGAPSTLEIRRLGRERLQLAFSSVWVRGGRRSAMQAAASRRFRGPSLPLVEAPSLTPSSCSDILSLTEMSEPACGPCPCGCGVCPVHRGSGCGPPAPC